MKGKKGDIMILAIFFMVIVLLVISLTGTFSKGCKSNSDCPKNNYCGVDKACHEIPVIEKTIVKEEVSYDLQGPALILSFGLIAGAVILKWKGN